MMDQEEAYEVFLEHVFSTTTVNEENDIDDVYDSQALLCLTQRHVFFSK